jgi:hypothetical protein
MAKVFFSYSHRDEEYRNELEVHLTMLKRQGIIETWHDRRISAGKDIHGEISQHLETADVILLLVSAYFLASDYCYDVEMARALERHRIGEARVIPIIVHPCDWKNASFGHLRATPSDGKPISKHSNLHDAYLSITEDIRQAVEEISGKQPAIAPRAASPARKASAAPKTKTEERSSNLRVRRQFSDQDRDSFLDKAFEYMATFFENSLAELEDRNSGLTTKFRRIDRNHFTAAIYIQGEKKSSCRVWLGASIGDIAYASGDSGGDNSFNEALTVVDDGYSLLLRSLGLNLFRSTREDLTEHGAAEYLWSMLIEHLQ